MKERHIVKYSQQYSILGVSELEAIIKKEDHYYESSSEEEDYLYHIPDLCDPCLAEEELTRRRLIERSYEIGGDPYVNIPAGDTATSFNASADEIQVGDYLKWNPTPGMTSLQTASVVKVEKNRETVSIVFTIFFVECPTPCRWG